MKLEECLQVNDNPNQEQNDPDEGNNETRRPTTTVKRGTRAPKNTGKKATQARRPGCRKQVKESSSEASDSESENLPPRRRKGGKKERVVVDSEEEDVTVHKTPTRARGARTKVIHETSSSASGKKRLSENNSF